jgi:hypothetical protein
LSKLRIHTKSGESVFDPFCGSGTSLVASLAHGRLAIGTDIDVLAGMLSEVKCQPRPPAKYDAWRSKFIERLSRDFAQIAASWPATSAPSPGDSWMVGTLRLLVPSFPELRYWFPPQLIAALATIANAARDQGDEHFEKIALVSLSASIVSKWPNTLSYAMDIDPRTNPPTTVLLEWTCTISSPGWNHSKAIGKSSAKSNGGADTLVVSSSCKTLKNPTGKARRFAMVTNDIFVSFLHCNRKRSSAPSELPGTLQILRLSCSTWGRPTKVRRCRRYKVLKCKIEPLVVEVRKLVAQIQAAQRNCRSISKKSSSLRPTIW